MLGRVSTPEALITKRAVTPTSPEVVSRHRLALAYHSAPVTMVANRICGERPYLATQRSAYALSSRPGAYERDQFRRCSNENW